MIPKDWSASTLGDHLKAPIRNGYSPVCPDSPTGIWILSLAAVTPHGFSAEGVKPAPPDDPKVHENLLAPGDLVVSRSNTPDRVGLAGIYSGQPSPCAYPDLMMRVRCADSLDSRYLLAHLLSHQGRRYLSDLARGSSSSMVKIDRATLESFHVPIPPTKAEQQAIAEALSDVDAMIESLEQLIAKKRQIKQGITQELLTGKRRLPGFEGQWNEYRLGELAAPIRNAIVGGPFGSELVSNDYVDFGVPVVRGQNMGGHFLQGPFVYVSEEKARALAANLARPGDLVFTQRGTLGQVSLVPDGTYDRYLVSQSQMKITLNLEMANTEFVYQFFTASTGQWRIQNSAIQTGVPHINLGILRALVISMPEIAEQEAIAAVLTDMDAELDALEAKLTKTRHLKSAMMHDLLTGRIRLV